jgi:hypothetical protein
VDGFAEQGARGSRRPLDPKHERDEQASDAPVSIGHRVNMLEHPM